MSARISWFSLENSLNPFEPHEESSPFPARNNQNSISLLGKYSAFPRQQESRSMFNFQLIVDNFINKNDSLMSRQDKFAFELIFQESQQPSVEESFSQSPSEISQSQLEIPDFELRKGLKNLAKLLMKILRKKRFDNSKNLTAQIEQILMKGKKLSKNELARQSKNIRRRTYDALNVMVAANVLGPDLAFVKRINTSSFTKKCGAFVGEKKQLANKNEQMQERIQNKKYLLKKLKSKKSAVEWWIQKKKRQFQNSPLHLQQNFKFFKNSYHCSSRQSGQKIFLPMIFIHSVDENCLDNFEKKDENLVVIKSKSGELKLFSQIDAFQLLKSQEQVLQESPFHFQKSKRFDFRSLELPEKEKNQGEFSFKFFNK